MAGSSLFQPDIIQLNIFTLILNKKRKDFFQCNHPIWLCSQMVILSHIQGFQRLYRACLQILNGSHISPETCLQHIVLSHDHKGLKQRSQNHEIIKNGQNRSIPGVFNQPLWPQIWHFFKSFKSQRPKITLILSTIYQNQYQNSNLGSKWA